MADQDQDQDQDQDKAWYRDPVKVIGLVGVTVTAMIGLAQLYDRYIAKEPAAVSVLYVLDVSGDMAGRIGKVGKLDAVRQEILEEVRDQPDFAAALRLSGPGCSVGAGQLAVDFGQDNLEDFERSLSPVRPGGELNFARSVRAAVNDLVDEQNEGRTRSTSLVVFVGGRDDCVTNERSKQIVGRSMRFLARTKAADVSIKFVGVKAPRATRRLLRELDRRADELDLDSDLDFADREAELGEAAATGPSP